MSVLLADIARLQLESLAGLKDLATPDGLRRRLYELGYRMGFDDAAADAFALGATIVDTIDEIADTLIYSRPRPEDLPGLIAQIRDLVGAIRDFSPDTSQLTAPFDDPAFWQDLGMLLADQMVREMLDRRLPALKLVLFAIGAIKVEDLGDSDTGRSGVVESLDFGALGRFIADPAGTLAARFGVSSNIWTGIEARILARHLQGAGLSVRARRLSDTEAAAIQSLPVTPGQIFYELLLIEGALLGTTARREAGISVLPMPSERKLGLGLFASDTLQGADLPLGPDWKIALDVASDDILQLTLSENGVTPEQQAFTVSATLVNEAPETMLLAGDAEATRLELEGFGMGLSMRVDGGTPEVSLSLELEGLALTVAASDGVLAEILGDNVGVSLDLLLTWSSRTGFTVGGSVGLRYTLPTEKHIGPITLRDLTFAATAGDDAPTLEVTANLLGLFGPFQVTVGGMGLRLALETAADGRGLVGPYDPVIDVLPPNLFGLDIDATSVSGGGVLSIEETRYSGALSIDVVAVGISAITVIDTALPGDPGGWAFFAALTLEFPAIPLGFGFTLSGVGGLIALNRGLDTIAIAGGLKSGAVDALLFPNDPVNDAPLIVSMIDDYFPIMDGNTVVGPIVEIGWGAPKTLLTAQIGVMISLPQGNMGLLGSISALLPDPAAPLLTLNMDIVGEIDLPGGTLFMTASLHDSHLLEIFELSGDMGMYLSVGDQPYFLLSVGGYHPGFDPPGLVPAPLHDLARMQASVEIASNVSVALGCYFAVTSNSVQYGAFVSLVASVEIWPATYSARGDLSFDILLRFSPFAIVADFAAGVGIYSGNKELMGVHLEAHLEGPKPWFASGYASFKFFGLNVDFEVVVGGSVAATPPEQVPLRGDVVAALKQASAWQESAPALGVATNVIYLDPAAGGDGDDRVWVRPDRQLKVSQSIAPLNRTIEIVGQGVPVPGDAMMSITAAGLGDTALDPITEVLDWFAPAQFELMTAAQRLARASFEEMTAGVSFGRSDARTTAFPDTLGRSATLDYEEVLWEDAPPVMVTTAPGMLVRAARAGGAAQALARAEPPRAQEFTVELVAFTVINAETGHEATKVLNQAGTARGGVSQSAALNALARQDSASRRGYRVVSAASVTGAPA